MHHLPEAAAFVSETVITRHEGVVEEDRAPANDAAAEIFEARRGDAVGCGYGAENAGGVRAEWLQAADDREDHRVAPGIGRNVATGLNDSALLRSSPDARLKISREPIVKREQPARI